MATLSRGRPALRLPLPIGVISFETDEPVEFGGTSHTLCIPAWYFGSVTKVTLKPSASDLALGLRQLPAPHILGASRPCAPSVDNTCSDQSRKWQAYEHRDDLHIDW